MSWWSRLRNTFGGSRHSTDIQEELQFHLDMDRADGYDPRQARLRLGNPTRIAEETRSVGIVAWLSSAVDDARYGLRLLRKSPAVMLGVGLSLTIGVGANTAIFSLVDAALLKPLPVSDPDSLAIVSWTNNGFPPPALITNHNGEYIPIADGRNQGSSVPAFRYRQLAREQTSFATLIGLAAYPDGVAISADSVPAQQVSLQYVSSNFFQGLGVEPAPGRPFLDEEDRVGADPVVIVSHRFWMNRLTGDVNALGRTVRINAVPARIVGVAPPGFFGLRAGQWPDVYSPLAMKVAFQPNPVNGAPRVEDDRNWWIRMVGRLRPEGTAKEAASQLGARFHDMIAADAPGADPDTIPQLVSRPGRRGLDALNENDQRALWILMLLVGVLLLVVCANVANLLLSRSVGRARESAMRLALGAPRVRLLRQHLIESAVLAALGGAAGLGLGYVFAQAIHLLFQAGRDASSAFDLHIDGRVLGYTVALSMLTAMIFGLAPAIRAARADLNDVLKTKTRSTVGQGLRLPRLLVTGQIALCLTALVAAGLLGRSLETLRWLNVGFDRNNLAYATVSPARAAYPAERIAIYMENVRNELARIPGVDLVSPVQTRPLSGGGNNSRVNIPGHPWDDTRRANLNSVGDRFFETVQMRMVSGRPLDARDMRPDSTALVVDELFASRYFPGENAVGRRLGLTEDDSSRYEIVGVASNSLYNSLRRDLFPTVYSPYRPGGTIHFAIRSRLDAVSLGSAVRAVVASIDPQVPLVEFHTQTSLIDRMLRTERLLGVLSGAFGLIALLLAAVGLASLLAYAVARRTSEIGVRIAVGAAAGDVIRMVVRDSLGMVGIGVLVGLPCALVVGRALRAALFRLEPLDPWTLALSLGVLLTVALAAAWIPARRAAHIDPVVALREG